MGRKRIGTAPVSAAELPPVLLLQLPDVPNLILRGTPSLTQVLSYVGLCQGSLLSSAPLQFKPLPVLELLEYSEEHEEALFLPRLMSPGAVPVHGGGERTADSPPFKKLMILRGTPSLTQVLSYVGLCQGSLLSSAPLQFKPLPVLELLEYSEEHEEALFLPRLMSPGAVPVHGGGERTADSPPFKKLMVVFDLDETLVCAYETSSLPAMLRSQATDSGINWLELECISSDKEFEGKPKINYVTVFERPGLKEFLNQLSEFADLILFTAGLEGYARPLVDKIDSANLFRCRLYRPSTISTEYREHVKDLSCLSKDFCRIWRNFQHQRQPPSRSTSRHHPSANATSIAGFKLLAPRQRGRHPCALGRSFGQPALTEQPPLRTPLSLLLNIAYHI
ncbi:protein-serine/threonine phosphatase [Salvia divinorum]|uniref:Mitochondrial import inner membrane translocase subunit TIM50 n=1 Tax=Salvia divinorum TaxID=28513 RepID=A0ABD1GKV6_SALDI